MMQSIEVRFLPGAGFYFEKAGLSHQASPPPLTRVPQASWYWKPEDSGLQTDGKT